MRMKLFPIIAITLALTACANELKTAENRPVSGPVQSVAARTIVPTAPTTNPGIQILGNQVTPAKPIKSAHSGDVVSDTGTRYNPWAFVLYADGSATWYRQEGLGFLRPTELASDKIKVMGDMATIMMPNNKEMKFNLKDGTWDGWEINGTPLKSRNTVVVRPFGA